MNTDSYRVFQTMYVHVHSHNSITYSLKQMDSHGS